MKTKKAPERDVAKSISDVARILGAPAGTVMNWVTRMRGDGVDPGTKGAYRVGVIRRWAESRIRHRVNGSRGHGEVARDATLGDELVRQRIRRLGEQATALSRENRQADADLVPLADVHDHMQMMITIIADEVDQLPERLQLDGVPASVAMTVREELGLRSQLQLRAIVERGRRGVDDLPRAAVGSR